MQNDSIDNLRLDINRDRVRGTIYVRRGDTKARTIHLSFMSNGQVVDLSDAIFCELLILKPDLNECDQTMVRVGNELQYTFRTQDINVAGECKCQAQVTFSDGAKFVGPEFSVMVCETEINPKHEESMNEYGAIQDMLVEVTALKAAADEDAETATNEADRATDEADFAVAAKEAAEGFASDCSDYKDECLALKGDCEDLKQDCQDIKDSLPTVYDATLTIQVNGSNVQTFSANASSNATANIVVPTKTSDITNDSDYVSDASYVHTDSNFTAAEKTKLSGVEAGAEVNVQSDWTQADSTADDYIKNKPNIPDVSDYYDKTEMDTFLAAKVDKVTGKDLSTNDYTDAEKTKLGGIAAGAEVNVQSDWNQSDNTADDFIKNKPSIPDAQIQSDWNQADNTKADFIKNKPTIAQSDWNQSDNTKIDYIKNKPTIPDAQIQSDWNQSDNTKADFIKNKPDISGIAALTARVQALETKVAFLESVSGYPFEWPEPEE